MLHCFFVTYLDIHSAAPDHGDELTLPDTLIAPMLWLVPTGWLLSHHLFQTGVLICNCFVRHARTAHPTLCNGRRRAWLVVQLNIRTRAAGRHNMRDGLPLYRVAARKP